MNKPLTIEELKAMNAGDWIWLVFPTLKVGEYAQVISTTPNFVMKRLKGQSTAGYYNYNDIWLAYKNKERAED